MTVMSKILFIYSIYFIFGYCVSYNSEKRFFSLFSKERREELGMLPTWKLFLLNPFWIIPLGILLPVVTFFSPLGMWNYGPKTWFLGKSSFQGLSQAQVNCADLTKEEIKLIISTYNLSPKQVDELELTIRKMNE